MSCKTLKQQGSAMKKINELPNNKRILQAIEERLVVGAKEHGNEVPLDGTRNHIKDALEECFDMIVYIISELLEIQDKKDAVLLKKLNKHLQDKM